MAAGMTLLSLQLLVQLAAGVGRVLGNRTAR